jgi:glycosyltransferase involved in cell wall biosynthesis
MRVVLYTHPAYLESALGFIRALSTRVELHVLLEVSPATWRQAAFDVEPKAMSAGLAPAVPLLRRHFPPCLETYWAQVASFHFVVHTGRRFYAPASLRVGAQALAYIRRLGPDVVHFDSAPLRLGLLPGWPACRIVLSEHDPEPHTGERDWHVDLARWLTYRRVDRFVVHSLAARGAFARRYGVPEQQIGLARLGFNSLMHAWAEAEVVPEPRTVLFFGRLSEYKGLTVLFAAAERVCQTVPGVRFVIAGRPVGGYQVPPGPPLARGGRLEVLEGYLSNPRLVALCQTATLVVCPYLDATQSAVALTALGLGTPVVASRVGALPEYVTDGATGLLVAPGDAEALAEALRRVLEDNELRRRLRQNIADRLSNDRTWEDSAQALLDVYGGA